MTCASMFNNASSCQSLCSLVLPVWPERSVAFDWVRTQKTSCRSKGTPATITRLATKLVLFWHTTVRSISKDFLTNLTVLLLIRIVHGPNELKAESVFLKKRNNRFNHLLYKPKECHQQIHGIISSVLRRQVGRSQSMRFVKAFERQPFSDFWRNTQRRSCDCS